MSVFSSFFGFIRISFATGCSCLAFCPTIMTLFSFMLEDFCGCKVGAWSRCAGGDLSYSRRSSTDGFISMISASFLL